MMVLLMAMSFRRGSKMGTQIHSLKHIIDSSGALSGGATSVNVIASTVNSRADPFNPVELVVGETVNAFFLSVFIIGSTGAPINGQIDWYIAKSRANQNPVNDFPNPQATGISPVRNQIFHEEKGLAGSGDGTPMAFKGVVVIPRGMRRVRDGDQFFIKIRSEDATNDAQFCIKAIFKSFS